MHGEHRGLPYRDSFANGKADEWKAFGGDWQLTNGSMRNDSNERGALLVTGSPYWHNYSVEADINMIGARGDAGLVIRSGNEEKGVNAYSGYYAGMTTGDHSLVLGRAEHGWLEAQRKFPSPGDIRPFEWYHLKLLAYGCHIVASVTGPQLNAPFSLAINDPDCRKSGRIGLRSYSLGGIWRNVRVQPASVRDLQALLKSTADQQDSAPRIQPIQNPEAIPPRSTTQQLDNGNGGAGSRTRSMASLRLSSFAKPDSAVVRGVVTMTSPQLFVQDSTGGIYVPHPNGPVLRVGDEVEVRGQVHPGAFSSTIDPATVQQLWSRTPMPPVSVTVSEASTGKFDATFIEVQGRLVGKERGPEQQLILDMDSGPQSLRAILNPGRGEYLFDRLKLYSNLQLRGICAIDPGFARNATPFVLLLGSNEDVEVLAGPPWWSTWHVIAIVIVILLTALIANFVYHRAERWRLHAILEERERLAHEIHDTLAQSFAGIGFQLQAIRNRLPEGLQGLDQQLELASNLVRHSHEEARRSIATLRPEALQSENLLAALEACAQRMVEGGAIQIIAEESGIRQSIPLRVADAFFRIGQEAIANAIRHAHPSRLAVRLGHRAGSVEMQIEDDGIGFAQSNSAQGFGIRGMQKRARGIGAKFNIESVPGESTRVVLSALLPPRGKFPFRRKFFNLRGAA